MTRPRGGYIGFNRVPAASALNSAASGVWTVREAEAMRRATTWPFTVPAAYFANQVLWLDASDNSSVTTVSGNVSQWSDKSGSGNHVSQSTLVDRPAYQTAVVNGLNAINFGGAPTNHRLFRSSFTVAQPSVFTVFTVNSSYNPANTLVVWDTGSGDRFVQAVDPGTLLGFYRTSSLATQRAQIGTALTTNKTYVSACVSDATGHQLWLNGSKGTDATAGTTGFNGISIGNLRGNPDPVLANEFTHFGRICEIIVYSTKKTDTDRAAIESYLASKWAIT
jgi:hypothetical protein